MVAGVVPGIAAPDAEGVRRAWLGVTLTIALVLLSWGPNGFAHVLRDPDTFWHIATGRHILATGSWPTHDPFSHTVFGTPWIQHEWAADIVLAAVYGVAGCPD